MAALSGDELQTDGAEDVLEDNLAALQQVDEELKPIIVYLTTGVLPGDDKHARQVTLTAPCSAAFCTVLRMTPRFELFRLTLVEELCLTRPTAASFAGGS